jgi:hypothetical protein
MGSAPERSRACIGNTDIVIMLCDHSTVLHPSLCCEEQTSIINQLRQSRMKQEVDGESKKGVENLRGNEAIRLVLVVNQHSTLVGFPGPYCASASDAEPSAPFSLPFIDSSVVVSRQLEAFADDRTHRRAWQNRALMRPTWKPVSFRINVS